ncbi:MAG: transcriptional repressor [Duncaniella sp.]|nr:transcriptional repressor [Bacteroides sp.]MDE6066296.1 transcriptional repressor [Duncaniella sp.]
MNEDKRKGIAHETLRRYITDHHRRCTPERFAVLDTILDMPSRFTVDELCDTIEGGDFRVSRATVYNTVELLSEAGMLRKMHTQTDTWEVTLESQFTVRLVCRKCGKIRDVRDQQLWRTLTLKRYQSFIADSYEVCLSGYCPRCRPKDRRNKKQN